MILKNTFQELATKYTANPIVVLKLWDEIENSYSSSGRYYHVLSHLEHMRSELVPVQTNIKHWEVVLFSLFYHDIVYKPTSNHNEEKSAELAEARLTQIAFPFKQIERCKQIILATKTHVESTDADTNYFTDADLCILGQNWENYLVYTKNVRKEYSIYPDLIYNPGRKKVLNRFLAMKRIFKTDFFFVKFEESAKNNLARELQLL
jgi:predicted metal-dependent HD superfamily phosphohydrolase